MLYGFINLYSCIIITVIIAAILLIGVNLVSISFISANAQSNTFSFEQIQHMMMGRRPHMMGPGPHHNMMANRMQQMQPNSPNSFSTINGNNNTTIDNKNSFHVSIVLGAASLTTNAYQPNPVYIKEGQKIIWTNNDNNIHTVTQRDYFSGPGNNYQGDTIPIGFNSGILNIGQSFAHLFYKEGKYDYYCAIHPWMIGQVIVSTNSNFIATDTNNNKTSISSPSMSMSMLQRGNIAMGFDQNKIRHNFTYSEWR